MPKMFCPQCGLELDLDSSDVRFCRYCGLALADTRDSLRGYSEKKRVGFSVVIWSYVLLLMLTLLLHAGYVPLETGWGYWLSVFLIVISVSFFTSAALSSLKPELFSKFKYRGRGALGSQKENSSVLESASERDNLPLPPLTNLKQQKKEMVEVRGSVTENTTRRLDE
jgi:hypothetical protein